MTDKVAYYSSIAVAALVTVAFAVGLLPYLSGPTASFEAEQQWCLERNGSLHWANVVGSHGGLHCQLPNGTSVHMHDVNVTGDTNA